MRIDDVAGNIAARNVHCIFLDTCALLDVIRSPHRGNIATLTAAQQMRDLLTGGRPSFAVVLASVFDSEWARNLPSVELELNKWLSAHLISSQAIEEAARELGILFRFDNAVNIGIDRILRSICDDIHVAAITLESEDSNRLSAVDRQIQAIAPASRGKDCLADCLMFEESLALGRAFQRVGFSKRMIFVSSNVKDFGSMVSPNLTIQADFAAANVEFSPVLHHAHSLIR